MKKGHLSLLLNTKFMVSIWIMTTSVSAFHSVIPTMPRTCIIQTNLRNGNQFLRYKMMNSSEMSQPIMDVEDLIVSTHPGGDESEVPKTLRDAYRRFFFGPDYGPSLIVASIAILIAMRWINASPLTLGDVLGFFCSVAFWSVQEHIIHDKLLHSNFDWQGKQIHKDHHEKTYFHISIDPSWLICSWLSIVFCLVCVIGRPLIPFPLGLSIVIGYAMSGLCYEWCHYIVHTKVQAKNKYLRKVKQHHIKHHLVNDKYWFGFSCVPMIDDVFGTNPDVRHLHDVYGWKDSNGHGQMTA